MIPRTIAPLVKRLALQYPVITITGPRQSGKTTLSRMVFPDYDYISLENIDNRQNAVNDPNGFLAQFNKGLILDEIQRAPDLTSYIQTLVDEKENTRQYILTGSSQFQILNQISQSLAGRTAILFLLPFSFAELYQSKMDLNFEQVLYSGFYPRIFDKQLVPKEFYSFYINTYLERDIRNLLKIKNYLLFESFIQLCAGRSGQILNLSNLANDVGISVNTIKEWISLLEASFILTRLPSFSKNIRKRITKSPKLYFYDVGLMANLLAIEEKKQVITHPLRGAMFETFIVSEFYKYRFNSGKRKNLYYYRDNTGNEIDLIYESVDGLSLIEIKSSATITSDYFKAFKIFEKIYDKILNKIIIYTGDVSKTYKDVNIFNYKDLDKVFFLLEQDQKRKS